jgi:hypothetical protein
VRHLTLTNVRSPPRQPLDRCHVSSFKSRSFDHNGHLNRTTPEHSASVRSTDSSRYKTTHRTQHSAAPDTKAPAFGAEQRGSRDAFCAPDASGGVRSDAPQHPVHTGTQQLPTSLTPDADVTRLVLTPFSAPDAPVTKTGQAPRCTTDRTLGPASAAPKPASGALKTVKNTFEKIVEPISTAQIPPPSQMC